MKRAVVCLTDMKRYGSVVEAAKAYGVSKGAVSHACSGRRAHAKGMKFVYADSPEAASTAYIGKSLYDPYYGPGKDATPKKTLCVTDGRVFNSMTEAANFYGMHRSMISLICSGRRKRSRGLVFKIIEA